MLANGIEEESRKRRKAGSISDYKSAEGYNKENSNPNIVNEKLQGKAMETLKDASGNNDNDETVDIMSMKVSDLRENLRERGLDTTGLKKDLQTRLQQAIGVSNNENETIDGEKVVKDALNEEMTEAVMKVDQLDKVQNTKAVEDIVDVDATMEKVSFEHTSEGQKETAETEMDEPIAQYDVEETVAAKENVDNNGLAAVEADKNQKKPFRALLQNVFSPGKNKSKKGDNSSEISSNLNKMNISDDANTMSVDDEPTEEVIGACSQTSKHDKRSSMICKMPLDELRVVHHDAKEIEPTIGGQSTHVEVSLTNVEATPSLSSKKPLNSVSSSSQKNQKKLHEIKQARKQRLDEIRNKVRNFSSIFTYFLVVCACFLTIIPL